MPVGGLAARRLLGIKSVTECVGVRYELDERSRDPAAASLGSVGWLNDPANRARVDDAARAIKAELGRLV